MPRPFLILALMLPASAAGLAAQTDYYARVGAIGAGNLLRDVIVSEITVKQSIAPMVALGASLPIAPRYRVGLEATLVSGGFHSDEGGTETDLGTLRTGSLLLNLEGPITGQFRWRAGLGGIMYWPSDEDGIFAQGGTTRWLAGGGVDYRRPVLTRWDLMASARYDYHRFTTDELDQRGFSSTQGVSRVSLSVGLARSLP
ncbi:MAG TPA: hypothetical protein VFT84_10205 [Gemmatimonadales bacterium]|nr:hypothetical protein [Gemmatimonadales bacterium]